MHTQSTIIVYPVLGTFHQAPALLKAMQKQVLTLLRGDLLLLIR